MKTSVKWAKQAGLSLVELMVAILIGLVILAGVIQVVVSSKTTFLGQEEMSFISENARYAFDVVGRDLKSAGYWGCTGANGSFAQVATPTATQQSDDGSSQSINVDEFLPADDNLNLVPIIGYEADSSTYPPAINGLVVKDSGDIRADAVIVRSAVGEVYSVASQNSTSMTLQSLIADSDTTNPTGLTAQNRHSLAQGDFVALFDEQCNSVSIVKADATTTNGAAGVVSFDNCSGVPIKSQGSRIRCVGSCNCNAVASSGPSFGQGATAMRYAAHAYYIGQSSAIPSLPALKRATLSGGTVEDEEIAIGVEDMELLYGLRSNSGNQLQYVTADEVDNWADVVTVEVSLQFRSQSASGQGGGQVIGNDGTSEADTSNDRLIRKVVTSNFRLRNRG